LQGETNNDRQWTYRYYNIRWLTVWLTVWRWTDGQIGQQVSKSSRTRELTKMKNEQFLRACKKSIIPLSYLSSMFE
jgi:hypothetical protein